MSMHDAAPIGVSDSDSSLGLAMVGQSILSLVIVVAVILVIGYLIKLFTSGSTRSKRHTKVVSSTMVGSKERVVIIEVENTWLVLGVGNGNVNKLHQLPKPEAVHEDHPVVLSGSFGERFAQAIKSKLK